MPCFSLLAQVQMRANSLVLRVNARVSCQAGGMACGLRPTLAGEPGWHAIAFSQNALLTRGLCGRREWGLRSQAMPPTLSDD